MAKGDNAGIGIGYNPGGPRIGGSATFGSVPKQTVEPMRQIPNVPNGVANPPVGNMPSIMPSFNPNMGASNQIYRPGVEPVKATGPMVPSQTPQLEPSFNPQDFIMNLINRRNQGY